MAELKTKLTSQNPTDFINTVPDETKRAGSFILLEMFERLTGKPAKMWGTSIIGFDKYHYKSEGSSQEGDWPLTGFSPRKQNLTLYVMSGLENETELFQKLGKHKTSKGCLYINKLADIDLKVLEEIIIKGYTNAKKNHGSIE